jgi:Mg2+-importing ATPase
LTLIGYIAFLEPPKESTAPALVALAAHRVTVKVLTGDNELVTAEVSRQVGLISRGTVLGTQIDAMDDRELDHAVEANTIFAKLSPFNKERIVRRLRGIGHIVGFRATPRPCAPPTSAFRWTAGWTSRGKRPIILLERNLMVLEQGAMEGRKTFSNMLKYIRMSASSNFGNVLSVVIASVFLPFLPMLPLQLLVQNLLYDTSQIAIPFDTVDAGLVSQPVRGIPPASAASWCTSDR